MTLWKSRTSNYWTHSSKIDTLVNQNDHAAPIRSPVSGQTGFSKSRGLRASVPFIPLPHPRPSTFLLSPYFSLALNAKNSFAWPEFCSLHMGTLATQANVNANKTAKQSEKSEKYCYLESSVISEMYYMSSNTRTWINKNSKASRKV